ncbi:hypothetical protein [Staphylococcus cohnii]
MEDWYKFKSNVVKAINKGEISFSNKVSEFDLAVHYATCILWEEGTKKFTAEQLSQVLEANVPNINNLGTENIYG